MHPTIMVTNGGPHPADKWADTTAQHICELIKIDEASVSPEAVAARKALPRFRLYLAEAFEDHHSKLQSVARDNENHAPRASHDTVESALNSFVDAASKTPFANWASSNEVKDHVRNIIHDHFATSIDIERQYTAKKVSLPKIGAVS